MNTTHKLRIALLASAAALSGMTSLHAQPLFFDVNINTASLGSDSSNAPFYLDLDMIYGNSSLAANTATLSSFKFTGGSAVGSGVATGGASGSLSSTVSLTASSTESSSEFYQQFSSGVTDISFLASITENGPDVGSPTEFTATILDSSLGFPAQIFTTAPDTESLVTLDLNSANTESDVNAYSSLSSADGNTPVLGVKATVPEAPTSTALLGGGAIMLALFVRRLGGAQVI